MGIILNGSITTMTDVQNHANNNTDYGRCQIPATHRRLAEAHLLWHQTLSHYQEPDAFRANLNATIQSLRNVTFALQSEKKAIPKFDEWYEKWRTRLAEVPDARWLINARNAVVKQGDLEITSIAVVRVLTWKDNVLIESQIPPGAPTSLILNNLALLELLKGSEILISDLRDAALEIERRWSVAELKGRELLETLASVFGLVSDVVLDAHAQMNQLECIPTDPTHTDFRSAYHPTGILECMAVGREQRTERSKLASRESYEVVTDQSPLPADNLARARRRYGLGRNHHPEPWQVSDPIVIGENILQQAKQILKKDRSHARMIFIRDGRGAWHQTIPYARDRTEKYILMRVTASFMERVGADALIDVSEAWILPAEASLELEHHDMENAPSRKEVLQLVIASRDGIRRSYRTPFTRGIFGGISLEETDQSDDANGLHYLMPVFEVWRRQRTKTLSDGERRLRVWEPDPLDTCFCGGPKRFIECCRPMLQTVRRSDSISQVIQTALQKGDSDLAEQLARASLAQYVIWIKQHTAPTRHVAAELHSELTNIDVLALQSHVQLLRETFAVNGHADELVPALVHLSEVVNVPELALRLMTLAAQSQWELGDVAGAVAKLRALGSFDRIDDSLALILASKPIELPDAEIRKLLTKAVSVAYSDNEKISARLELAKHLLDCGERESALTEIDSLIADLGANVQDQSTLAEALSLRWRISTDEEDFRAARAELERFGSEEDWQTLVGLLIDHGDYDDANEALTTALEAGEIVAQLLAVDLRLRMGQTDSARELLVSMAAESIPPDLLYPYAHTMGLVALMGEDPELRSTAALNLRKVVAIDNAISKPAKALLAALEE
jgi:metal-responsive CopG/Arc/MetJ family transcriptional regulator